MNSPQRTNGHGKPASSSSADPIGDWLLYFGDQHQRKVPPSVFAVWRHALRAYAPETLELAFKKTLETCRYFPTVADVLGNIQRADDLAQKLSAEDAWQHALRYAQKWRLPDMGLDRNAPALAPAIEDAVRAAGGLRHLESCSTDELTWARKRFIERYEQLQGADPLKALPTTADARRVLAEAAMRMSMDATSRALPAARVDEPLSQVERAAIVEESRPQRPQRSTAQVAQRARLEEMTDEEFAEYRAEMKRKALEHAEKMEVAAVIRK